MKYYINFFTKYFPIVLFVDNLVYNSKPTVYLCNYSLQFCHIGQFQSLLLTVDVDRFFFTILVQLCIDVWSSQPSVMQADDSDEIVLYIASCNSMQYSLMLVQVVVLCNFLKPFYSCLVLKRKMPSNQFFKRYLVILWSKILWKTCIYYDK